MLRGETLGISMLRSYWFHFEGKPYLKPIVGPLIKSLTKNKSLEIDPARTKKEIAVKNLAKLIKVADAFFETLYASYSSFPKVSLIILKKLFQELTKVGTKIFLFVEKSCLQKYN